MTTQPTPQPAPSPGPDPRTTFYNIQWYTDGIGRRMEVLSPVDTIGLDRFVGHGVWIPCDDQRRQCGPPITFSFAIPADTLEQAYAMFDDLAGAEIEKQKARIRAEMTKPRIALPNGRVRP